MQVTFMPERGSVPDYEAISRMWRSCTEKPYYLDPNEGSRFAKLFESLSRAIGTLRRGGNNGNRHTTSFDRLA